MLDSTSNSSGQHLGDNGKSSTFGRDLMAHVQNRLPFSRISNETNNLNPKFKYFQKAGIQRSEALVKNSISSSNDFNNMPIGGMGSDTTFGDVMYANIPQNKPARIQDYRTIAAYSEVADALDEICDEIINSDDDGRIVRLSFPDNNTEISVEGKTSLIREFRKYVDYFDLKQRGWQYFRQLLVEGEVFFEIIIHDQYANKGCLGLVNIPAELIDPVYNNIQNMLVKGFIYRKPIYNAQNPSKIDKMEFIPMEENQIVYINSGVYNEGKTLILPFLENCRRPYRQLSLIEDAIVIYRLVRAPERLVFNVDVGNMPPPKAEAYLRKLIQQYWSRKTFDLDQGDVVKKFNPQSMLDAFWFAKRQGSEGTSVEQLAGGANLGELSDLMYFVKKLYRSLKVPSNRLDPEDAHREGSDILREELKFARFVVRQQQRFASGIKKGFITHLKFTGMWNDLDIDATDLEVDFNVPTNFYELRENQRLELKANNYNNLSTGEYVSATYAQKKYLGWEDKDVLANRQFLRKDAELQWELAQISEFGPGWKEAQIAADAAGEVPGADPMGGEMGGGGIPEFGGGEAEVGGEETDLGADEAVPDAAPAEPEA